LKKIKYILPLIAAILMTALPAWAIDQVDGVYQISSAQDLRDFATLVNGGTTGANAVLTTDIDLGGEVEFPNIGKTYTGTFDGQGFTISGFLRSTNANTNNAAFFNTTNNATIKRFTLKGKMVCTGLNVWGVASVVGYAQGTTKIEDVTSSVEMTFKNCTVGTGQSGLRIVGGIAGRAAGTINRCRFNGKMDFSESEGIGDRIGGICANPNGVTISNCLFDGTIITNCTKDLHVVGGITGQNNGNGSNPITNCLSKGTFTFAEGAKTTNCGAICGVKVACTNCYNNSNIGANASSGATEVGTTSWSTITDNLNGGASVTDCNWKVVSGQAWPIPLKWTKTIYTITFVDYDGTELNKQYIEAGSELTVPPNPSRTGYTFTGWSPTVVTTPTENATYTAQYDINRYTVKFNTDGGDAIADVTENYNTDITLPTAVKTGYRFDGWNTASDGTGTSYAGGAKYTITADATLYAQYTINQYTIKFNTNGGDAIADVTQNYNTSITLPTAVKIGHRFDGWNTVSDGSGTTYLAGANYTITADATLYAQYTINQYTITFDTKGGTFIAPITQDYGTPVTAPADPEKAHYRFDGWDKTIPSTMPAENMTITATYTYVPNAQGIYEIGNKEDFFNFATIASTNTSTNAKLVDNINLEEEAFNGIGTNDKPYTGEFDGDGHTISGFKRTMLTGAGNALFNYVSGGTVKKFKVSGSMTLAHTEGATYYNAGVVGYAFNGALVEDIISSVDITCTTSKSRLVAGVVGRINGPTTKINRCRYNGTINAGDTYDQIAGICADIQGGGIIQNCLFDGKIICNSTNTSLYLGGIVACHHNGDINVSYNLANGTIKLAEGATATNSGLVYGNLATNNTLTASVNYYAVAGSKIGTTDFTQGYGTTKSGSINTTTFVDSTPWIDICIALNNGSDNWGIDSKEYPVPGESAPVNYTLTFNTDGGTTIDPITLPAGAAVTVPADPTKTGYTFTGWVDESGQTTTIPTIMPAANRVFKATWKINQYTITFDTDGGSPISPITQDYGTTIVKPADPTKTGYTFDGWDREIPNTMPAENITIKATWKINQYTITFDTDGGSAIAPITQDYGTAVTAPANPTKTGYDFAGWKDTDGNDTTVPSTMPAENITLKAKWNVISYKLTYKVDGAIYKEYNVPFATEITAEANPTKDRYTFSGWSEIPATMPAHDVTVTGTFTYTATNGVYEIGNREDYVNFVAVTKTNAAANAKLIADINLNNEAVDCIGTWASKYSGTFDGQGYTISNYSRTTTDGSYSGMFGAVENATIKNFKVNGSVTISSNVSTSQQHGSVIGVSLGTSLIEDVWSSVNVNITGFAAQVGGFAGRAGGTYNRCRYSGTVTTSTAYDKIGGFASNVYGGTIKNCLFDGTLDLTTNNAELKAGGFVSSNIEQPNHRIESCLVNGTVNIPNATEKCGIVIGFVDRNLNMTKTYYTTTETGSLTTAIGPVTSSWTLTGTAKDATSMDWSDVCEGLNPMTGSDGNWKIETGEGAKAYPVPIACEHTHTHQWDNGICPYDDEYQPIAEVNGAYEIGNLGQFLNFVDVVKNTPDANARLTNNFSIANSGFEAIDTYKGTFDGQGHTISGYSRELTTSITSGTGFFNKTEGATIKDVKFEGSLTITGENKSAFIGTIVGIATNTTFEDVTSSVSMSSAATVDGTQSNGLRILGGLVGALRGVSMNRCRYKGVMIFNANTDVIGDRFGGLVGWQQTTASSITNCLFDGTMTVQKNSIYIGGIVGQGLSGSTIQNSLFAGTITQTQGNANCGPIIGNTSSTSVSDTYYDLTGFNYTTAYNNTGTAKGSTTWAAIHQALGTANWVTEEGKDYPVPGEQNTEHTHNYENGFCTSLVGVCDARKEVPTYDEATSTYKIANAGQLFSFAEKYNDGTYAEACKAELTAAIDMDGAEHQFPGIGTKDKPFKGTFNGAGKAITEFARSIGDQNGQGFFNYVDGATIKNFSINGTLDINATAEHYYFGSVAGKITGTTTLEDITSTVIINLNGGKEKAVGGIVGIHDGASVINRCRYQGTIKAKNAYNNIGGIAGEENCNAEGGLNNTLFDGIISFNNDNSTEIIVGGLVGVLNSNGANINNCLSHGTITLPTGTHTKAGAVIGYAKDKKINLTRVLFTTCGSVTVAMGTGCSGCTLNVNPSYIPLDVTITAENTKLYDGVALAMLGEDNWRQNGTTNTDYPYPGIGGTAHTHTYNSNGFCIAEDGNYEEATTGTDGYYEIKNAGQLWWIAQQLKEGRLAKNIRFKLTQDIDMEGDAHGSFPGICPLGSKLVDGKTEDDWETAFQGIFDGQGHTINNYYRKIQSGLRQGLFNVVNNDAQIKNFNINGNLIVNASNTSSCALVGVVVGVARGTSTIEDINSSVNITASGSRGIGGIVGCLENTNNQPLTKLNRCRYNGTITVSGTNMNDGVGGLVGEIRSAIMTNVLFDGKIIVNSDANYRYVGGITGVARNNDNSEIHRALSHGTITLEGGYTANEIKDNTTTGGKEVQGSLTGIFIGGIYKTLYMDKCFHTTTGATGVPAIGPQIHEESETINSVKKITHTFVDDLLLGGSTDITTTAIIENQYVHIYDHKFHTTLGESNWAIEDYIEGNYPKPKKDATHKHYYENGFCTAGDGEYEKPTGGDGNPYIIDNGGKLYWFAEHFNAGEIEQDAIVELKKTSVDESSDKKIDMEGDKYTFPGIGTQKYKFMGKFDGNAFIIENFKRDIVNSEYTGFFNYTENAEIREFQLEGQINYNLNAAKSFHGTVVGYAAGTETLIEDVFSFVEVRMNNNHTRVWGGIAGRASGKINRCRYSGTVAKSVTTTDNGDGTVTTTIEAMASGEQIGGICGNAQTGLVIENCLFDGTIKSYCSDPMMRVAGILASNELNSNVNITIKNCLFNGCLDLKHTYKGEEYTGEDKITQNGIIAGFWSTGTAALINNVYYLKKCADVMKNLDPGNYETTPSVNDTEEIKGEPNWNEIYDNLDEKGPGNEQGNGNWTHTDNGSGDSYPTPGGNHCNHILADGVTSAYDEFGYCTICGDAKPLEKDTDGKYKMEAISDLEGFRDLINSGKNGTVEFNAKLTQDIDFSTWDKDFGEPIGNSHFNRYLYNFDGQGYSLLNVKIKTDDQYVGFFGFAGDTTHDCYIHDLTITGTVESTYDSKEHDNNPLYMGVVGKMYRGKIENVHSQLVLKNTSPTRAVIGGILGAAETEDENNSVVIDKCSFTGTCYANAAGNMGGIVGQTSKNTEVKNCTFAGSMVHTYQGINNQTNFSGVVGYNEEATFKGVQNCVIAGVLKTDDNRVFVNYGTQGNHKNALCGEDKIITNGPTEEYKAKYQGNYAWNVYSSQIPKNSVVFPTWVAQEDFISGKVCAIMNAKDDVPTDVQNGHPWGQVLGYQIGDISKGELLGNHTDGSPAQRVPFPGYQNPEKNPWKVVKDASNNYTADWYYLDDQGDTTPYPSDAASMKVKKIEYHRAPEYLTYYNSFCLPFEFTQDMKREIDGNAKIFKFNKVEGNKVLFNEESVNSIDAGTPFILYCDKNDAWNYINTTEGSSLAMKVTDATGVGLYGSFDTMETGWGFYKLNQDGTKMVKTVGKADAQDKPESAPTDKPISQCYPYRAYFKLTTTSGAKAHDEEYIPCFVSADEITEFNTGDNKCYNIMGQKVNENAKGIIIVNGKKYLKR